MTLMDTLVTAREALLSRSLGFTHDAVLNGAEAAGPPLPGPELAAALKRGANALKAAGIDAAGQQVDYSRLRASDAYVALRRDLTPMLRSLDLNALTTREQRLAFWINLYNVLILDATATFGVSRSVTEGRLGVVSFFRRAAYKVGGQRFSANDIEHGILRANRPHWAIPGPQLGPHDPRRAWRVTPLDPRIHFALNCASRSCPPIGVYDAERIDAQLDLAAASFIANDVAIDAHGGIMRLSSIFKWYAGDFGGRAGVLAFLKERLPDGEGRKWLRRQGPYVRLIYSPYDWGLNSVR
ncbi:MAG TPA: DUF547 domain-containing protein [Anaerolineae bacterium]|nr:DUF547 domain-containing protein [Anaerolineae bacterium]